MGTGRQCPVFLLCALNILCVAYAWEPHGRPECRHAPPRCGSPAAARRAMACRLVARPRATPPASRARRSPLLGPPRSIGARHPRTTTFSLSFALFISSKRPSSPPPVVSCWPPLSIAPGSHVHPASPSPAPGSPAGPQPRNPRSHRRRPLQPTSCNLLSHTREPLIYQHPTPH